MMTYIRRRGLGFRVGAAGGGATIRRGAGIPIRRIWFLIFLFCLISFILIQYMVSLPPPVYKSPTAISSCSSKKVTSLDDHPYILQEDTVCSTTCGGQCFPRVRDLCISHDTVTVCKGGAQFLPSSLRFSGKDQYWRRNVAIKSGICAYGRENEQSMAAALWIRGTQLVGDMKMMPNGHKVGPSPHHEAEKLIPAILLSRFYGFNGSSFYWFTDPVPAEVTSVWSMGLMKAFRDELDVKFSTVPESGGKAICFEDAVLFSGVTNAGYVPNTKSNDWLKEKVLSHCNIKKMERRKRVQNVVIINRLNSSREIGNSDEVEGVLERELGVPVKRVTNGVGDFCQQVRVVAEGDVFVTPHGSHNVNFLFARPGGLVLEAFPLLYYLDWFRNYVHSARLDYHELFGTWPMEQQGGMPLRMTLYGLLFGWKNCFSTRQCMNYAKGQDVYVDLHQLERLLRRYL
ncbi:unnamed protein product [Calypogeia fissa]